MKIFLVLCFLFFNNLYAIETETYAILYGIQAAKTIKSTEGILKNNIKKLCISQFEKDVNKNFEIYQYKDTYIDSCIYNINANTLGQF